MAKAKEPSWKEVLALIEHVGKNWTPEDDKRIDESTRNLKISLSTKGRVGTPLTTETKRKLSEIGRQGENVKRLKAMTSARVFSGDALTKMSLAKKGKSLSDAHKKNIAEGNKGRTISDQSTQKISASLKDYYSDPAVKSRRASINRRLRSKPVSVDGTIYPQLSDAALALGVSISTVTNRIKSPREEWKNYFFVDKTA